MILINKGSSNNVVLTLNESIIGADEYDFLFEFINDTTGEIKLFTATDISTATTRYNKFLIIENNIEDLYNGTISLTPIGFWSYNIYQMAKSSPVDLNPLNAVATLEAGKVFLKQATESPTPSFEYDDEKENIVFDEE